MCQANAAECKLRHYRLLGGHSSSCQVLFTRRKRIITPKKKKEQSDDVVKYKPGAVQMVMDQRRASAMLTGKNVTLDSKLVTTISGTCVCCFVGRADTTDNLSSTANGNRLAVRD